MATIRPDQHGQHRTAIDKNRLIILRTQNVCGICGRPVDKKLKWPDPLSPTIDHIIPVSRGGHPSALDNLQLAHRWCNRQKSNKLFISKPAEELQKDDEVSNDDLPLHNNWALYKAGGI